MNLQRYRLATSVTLVHSGGDYFQTLRKMIREARVCIHIQTYIFALDTTGNDILEELKIAARRGVKVFFLADGYGSKAIRRHHIRMINEQGIHFRLFSTFFSSESIYRGRRLHHKIIVSDRETALIGGINIADKYHGTELEAAWLDYAVLVKGHPCNELHDLCESFYHKRKLLSSYHPDATQGNIKIRFTRNDFVKGVNQIHKSYRNALYQSKSSVTFVASYFLPGFRFRRALNAARKRGIQVRLILAGKSDLPFLFYAEKFLYPFFLHKGIEVYEWKNSVMHAKAVIVDDGWVTIGSYNLNPVSHYLSIELNAEIANKDFSRLFLGHIDQILKNDCVRVTTSTNHSSSWLARARNSVLYYFFKTLFLVFISRKR